MYRHREVLAYSVSNMDFSCSHTSAGEISTPESFLKAIGRGSDTKISFESWDDLWKTNGPALKKAGLTVRDRRCVAFTKILD